MNEASWETAPTLAGATSVQSQSPACELERLLKVSLDNGAWAVTRVGNGAPRYDDAHPSGPDAWLGPDGELSTAVVVDEHMRASDGDRESAARPDGVSQPEHRAPELRGHLWPSPCASSEDVTRPAQPPSTGHGTEANDRGEAWCTLGAGQQPSSTSLLGDRRPVVHQSAHDCAGRPWGPSVMAPMPAGPDAGLGSPPSSSVPVPTTAEAWTHRRTTELHAPARRRGTAGSFLRRRRRRLSPPRSTHR